MLNFQLIATRNDLKVSKDRQDLLDQDIHSINELLKDTRNELAESKEKIHHLSVGLITQFQYFFESHSVNSIRIRFVSQIYQHKFNDLKNIHDHLLKNIETNAPQMRRTEENLTKLQRTYDHLLNDYG